MQPRSSFVSISGDAASTTDTRLAAAIYALDVPFDESQMAASFAGDGIRDKFITWFFKEKNPRGESSSAMAKAWTDDEYQRTHKECPLVNIKAAFIRKEELSNAARGRAIGCRAPKGPFIETHNTEKAASMERLGHPMIGVAFRDGKYWWRFPQAAGADFVLWDLPGKELEERLPDALISYLQCAFKNHRRFIDLVKNPKAHFAVVKHQGRIAVIGSEQPKESIDQLDRLLHRK